MFNDQDCSTPDDPGPWDCYYVPLSGWATRPPLDDGPPAPGCAGDLPWDRSQRDDPHHLGCDR